MRRVNMRERPLALNKKLSIVRAPELLDAEVGARAANACDLK
jgi:hypothetical protein